MRNPAERIHLRLGNRRCGNLQSPANEIAATTSHAIVAGGAKRSPLSARNGTGRSIVDDGVSPLDCDRSSLGLPFFTRDTPLFGLERHAPPLLYAEPKSRAANALDDGHDLASAAGSRLIGSAACEISRLNWALHEAQSRVQELASVNRRKDEFLAMLSHELRSPLASIGYAVRLLQGPTGDADAQHRTQALIERQLGRMKQLIDELLDVSRITNGRLHVERERLDLRVIVTHAIETLESDLDERNQRLAIELPDAPVWLQGDARRLEQVFVNLLANASRYTHVGGELAVWVHPGDCEAVVRIRDSGIGIAPNALAHIFDLFKQANEAEPRSRAGLGVGLAVVRELVELHEGSVVAASAGVGQGSEFTVRLRTLRV